MMDLAKRLSGRFRIVASMPRASEGEIVSLHKFSSIPVPEDYLDLVSEMTEIEIQVADKKFIRIWGPLGCVEMNEAYRVQKYIPKSLAIGDDEGGMAFIYLTGKQGFGLYKVGFGDLDVNDAEYISKSLEDFLQQQQTNQ